MGKTRPIRVKLHNESEKYEILKNATKLEFTANEDSKRMIINADMSFKEK